MKLILWIGLWLVIGIELSSFLYFIRDNFDFIVRCLLSAGNGALTGFVGSYLTLLINDSV